MTELVNFSSTFDGWEFPFSTVTEADFIARFREVADVELPDWDHRSSGDVIAFCTIFFCKALAQGLDWANQMAQEFSIFTARQDSSIRGHAQFAGYTPKSPVPARVDLIVHWPSPQSARILQKYELKITNRNVVGSAAEVFFENSEIVSISGGVASSVVSFVHGRTYNQEYTSNGQPNQTVELAESGVLDGFTTVTISSVAWSEVDSFLDSGPTDKHFKRELTTEGKTRLVFGNGSNGQIPTASIVAAIQYRTGVDESNLPKESLSYVFESPSPAVVTAEQQVRATGGRPADTKDQILQGSLTSIKTKGFLGTAKEIERYCESFSGVARARVYFDLPLIHVGIIPSGGGAATESLKTSLRTELQDGRIATGMTAIVDDVLYKIPIIKVLFTTKEGYVSSQVESSIQQAIEKLINPLDKVTNNKTLLTSWRRDFGQSLDPNEIRQVLAEREDIESDYVIVTPVTAIPVTPLQIIGDDGAIVQAVSRNTRTTGHIAP